MERRKYLVSLYQRLMFLAPTPNHLLISQVRKFVESCCFEYMVKNEMAVHDQLTLEKMRESLNKNPNSEWPLIIDNQVQVLQRFGNLSVHHKPEKINASEVWESIYPSLDKFANWMFTEALGLLQEFDMKPFTIQDWFHGLGDFDFSKPPWNVSIDEETGRFSSKMVLQDLFPKYDWAFELFKKYGYELQIVSTMLFGAALNMPEGPERDKIRNLSISLPVANLFGSFMVMMTDELAEGGMLVDPSMFINRDDSYFVP